MPEPRRLDQELRAEHAPPGERRSDSRRESEAAKYVKETGKKLEEFFRDTVAEAVKYADPYDAEVIRSKAKLLGYTYAAFAAEVPLVRRAIDTLMAAGTPITAAAFATATVALPILDHHGIIQLPPIITPFIGVELQSPPPPTEKVKAADNGNPGDTAKHPLGAI